MIHNVSIIHIADSFLSCLFKIKQICVIFLLRLVAQMTAIKFSSFFGILQFRSQDIDLITVDEGSDAQVMREILITLPAAFPRSPD